MKQLRLFALFLVLAALPAACRTGAPSSSSRSPSGEATSARGISAEEVGGGDKDPYSIQKWQYRETKGLMPY